MTSSKPEHIPGMGGQSRGSRKGLGGDQPNGPVEGQRHEPSGTGGKPHATTEDQVSEMESEGQAQVPGQPAPVDTPTRPK